MRLDGSQFERNAAVSGIGPCEFSYCPIDLDNGSGTGTPDSAVTIDDLLYFLAAFEFGTPGADLDNGTGLGVHDHAVTITICSFVWFTLKPGADPVVRPDRW